MATKDARSLSDEALEVTRRMAVKAVLSGRSRVDVAREYGIHRNTIGQWVAAYQAKGHTAFKPGKRGRPRRSALKGTEAATVVRLIRDNCPDQLHLPFYLWTREAVSDLIERRTGKRFSRWTVGRLLKRWNFTPQKPARRALKQNPVEVRRWLEETYPDIERQAKRENAVIHWGDEAGFRSDHVTGRSYSPRGQTPRAMLTGDRFGCNMISSITNRGALAFMVFKGRFVTDVYIEYLKRLIRHAKRRVFLIVDRHPVHVAKKVAAWLAAHRDRIRVFYLPSYSPELNPDEYLNHDVKANAVGRLRAYNVEEMVDNIEHHLKVTRDCPTIVARFFQEEHVRYAAG